MKNFVFGILLFTIGFVSAQNLQNHFDEGNTFYQNENYKKAIESYLTVIDNGLESSELYFNLGNAYYKSNQIAEAIYNYEKALLANPANKDAKVNLEFANRSIIDSIKTIPKSNFEKINDKLRSFFTYNNWAIITVVLSLIAGSLWMLFFFSTQPGVKKLYFTLGIILSLLCVSGLVITAQQYTYVTSIEYAIIFTDEVEVKSAPRKSSSEAFTLHEGTKVQLLDVVGTWTKIKLTDGQQGWLLTNAIKKL